MFESLPPPTGWGNTPYKKSEWYVILVTFHVGNTAGIEKLWYKDKEEAEKVYRILENQLWEGFKAIRLF